MSAATPSTLNSQPPRHNPAPVVLSIAFPYAPVGPCAVGGSEIILTQLEAAASQFGYRSVVVAHAASQPAGRLYGTPVPPGEITDSTRAEVERAHQANIDRALAENPVALVHMHNLDFHRYTLPQDVPVLVTLHLPPTWYPPGIWDSPSNFHFICVSETERQACPAHMRGRITVVQNGVPLPPASTLRAEGRYALLLSRICPEKNLHAGLDGAKLACMPAILAGETFSYEAHQRFFHEQIEPRLSSSGQTHEHRAHNSADAPTARFIGPVTGAAKARLLARAACLLQPSLAPETSSLASMEALAAGVPVIAVASGAVPEIVEHGRTGFLIDPADDIPTAIARSIRRLPEIGRNLCRATAEQRFGIDRMLNAYLRLYNTYARPRNASVPQPAVSIHPASTVEVTIHWLTRPEELFSLRNDWTDLWHRDPHATPFQHPAWLLPWWRQFGPDGQLHALTLRSADQRLLGMLPSYLYPGTPTGERKFLLLGAGTSDYLDGLFDPRPESVHLARSALRAALAQPGWTSLHLLQLRESSPLLAAADQPCLRDSLRRVDADPCYLIPTARLLPAKVRANVRRYRHRAEAVGQLTASIATSSHDALAAFDALATLHRERWQQRGETGVLADPRVLAHHREAIPRLLAADLLKIFSLTLDGNLLAVLYALADPSTRADRSLYLYLIGVNTRFAHLSPGTLLLHQVWDFAQRNGFATLDLLRGGETYKHLWGAGPQPTFGLHAQL